MEQRGAQRDEGKERFWRRVLQRWRRSGLTVRDFCSAQALAEASFYAWRRTIAERDQQATAGIPPVFVPLRVTPPPAAASAFEVVLGNGRVVRVPAHFEPATLRQLLAVLDEERPC